MHRYVGAIYSPSLFTLMPIFTRLALVAILLGCAELSFASTNSVADLLKQTEGMPEDFRAHFFDVPLLMRVELDAQFLGDASVLMTQQGTVQIIAFTDTHASPIASTERQRWADFLSRPRPLGDCNDDCGADLLAMHYDMQSSRLSLVTRQAEHDDNRSRFYTLPEGGSTGLILRNRLNVNAGDAQDSSGRYDLEARGSLGSWTTVADYQLSQTAYRNQRASPQRRRLLRSLYSQREYEGRYVRLGAFTPQHYGLSRQPRGRLGDTDTTVGIMLGSSDALDNGSDLPSAYPVYVTANRQSVAEIFRDGVMIDTQPVATGLQTLDTRGLPGGIYEVEIRLIEDGRIASTQQALIHKPTNWRDPDERWRYNVYLGQQRAILDSRQARSHGQLSGGIAMNYLAHPRVILGSAFQQLGRWRSMAISADWQALDTLSLSGNAYRSNVGTLGADVQMLWRYTSGSVLINHRQSWHDDNHGGRDRRDHFDRRDQDIHDGTRPFYSHRRDSRAWTNRQRSASTRSTSITLNQRFGSLIESTTRLTRDRTRNRTGNGVDMTLRYRRPLFGHHATWRLSVFDRPVGGYYRVARNRGIELGVTLSLSRQGRRFGATMGSRNANDGGRDQYGTFEVTQDLDHAFFRSVSATAMVDRYGLGGTGRSTFESQWARGNAFVQRSTYEGRIGGGANIESTLAIGGQSAAISGASASRADGGVILFVDSDLPNLRLRARDTHGGSVPLGVGRNFVPVKPYRTGTVQIDFEGRDAPAARIHPNHFAYHLNNGGVAYGLVAVTQTTTVIGRLVDDAGRPVRGAFVLNDAGTSVSEGDGFFVLEMSNRRPTITIRQGRSEPCSLTLDLANYTRDSDGLMVGDLVCAGANPEAPDKLAATPTPSALASEQDEPS